MTKQHERSDESHASSLGLALGLAAMANITLAALGLFGLFLLRSLLGLTEAQFMNSPLVAAWVYICSGFLILGLFVLLPLSVFVGRSKVPVSSARHMPWYGLFLIPLGLADPDWTIPRWISWPVLAILAFLVFLLVYGLIFSLFIAA
jgi:hypothetical protein